MKSKSIFLRQETCGNFHMRLRVICKKAVLLYKTKILRFFPSFLTITFFCHVSHLFIEIPEGIMRIAFVLFEGSCFSTSLLVRMPTLGKPSVFRIQFLQHHGLIYIIRFRQSVLHGFLQKQCKVYCCTVCNIKMSAPSITKKRDATPGIHQAKRQCRIYAIFPPFIFSFDHQAGNAVNSTFPPLHVITSISGKISTRCVSMKGNDSQCPFGIPCCKIPRISCHRRMSERNNRNVF